MHLEATAVLLGMGDLGGKLTTGKPCWQLSRAMVGHAEAIRQMLFGHVIGFVSQSALSQKHQNFKWVLASHVGPIWGSNARIEATFCPSWALLRYLEATALLLRAKSAKSWGLEGKLSHREVMLKLSWAMLCHVEAMCQVLFGHVVGFASRNALTPAGPRF